MPATINIGIDSNAAEIVQRIKGFPPNMAEKIAAAMKEQNDLTITHIQLNHLTAPGATAPLPLSEHRLRTITKRLKQSLWASDPVITGNTVESSIGTNVRYAGLHEFGFTGTVRAHRARIHALDVFTIRGRTVKGWQIANLGNGKRPTRVAEGFATIRAHRLNIPARAPIGTGIEDRAPNLRAALSAALIAAWEQPNTGAST